MNRRDRRRILTTVLFTDIVGSTEEAVRVGDARWRETLTRHHALVRRDLRRFRGVERDTAGDGFFATFEQPTDALRCGWAIVHEAAGSGGSPSGSGGGLAPGRASPSPGVAVSGPTSEIIGNIPPNGPIHPGDYLIDTVRGGAVVSVPDDYWVSSYGKIWSAASYPDTRVRFMTVKRPAADACGGVAASTAPPSEAYRSLIDWFTHHPALSASGLVRRLFGSTEATQLDLAIDPRLACHSASQPTVALDTNPDQTMIGDRAFTRVYAIDSRDPFVVVLDAPTRAQLKDAAVHLEAVLKALRPTP